MKLVSIVSPRDRRLSASPGRPQDPQMLFRGFVDHSLYEIKVRQGALMGAGVCPSHSDGEPVTAEVSAPVTADHYAQRWNNYLGSHTLTAWAEKRLGCD
jgi:hypothetical protein